MNRFFNIDPAARFTPRPMPGDPQPDLVRVPRATPVHLTLLQNPSRMEPIN